MGSGLQEEVVTNVPGKPIAPGEQAGLEERSAIHIALMMGEFHEIDDQPPSRQPNGRYYPRQCRY